MLRSAIGIGFGFGFAVAVGFTARTAGATELADVVAGMAPGTWAEVPAIGMTAAFTQTGGNSGIAIGYSESVKWDPATGQLFYIGMDHNETDGERFVAYRESDNTFVLLQQPAFAASSGVNNVNHEYDHTAIDPYGRHFYFRYGYSGRSVYRFQIDTGVWDQLPDNEVLEYNQCCGGMDWLPEQNGLLWVQGGEMSGNPDPYGGVFLFTNGSWARVGQAGTYLMGSYHNFAEYNPIHKVTWFGGGNDPGGEKNYELNGDQITPLADAPVQLGVSHAVHTIDPISGDYLILTKDKQFWSYDISAKQWSDLGGSNVPETLWTEGYDNEIQGVVAGPMASHGVTVFYGCVPSECHMLVYKHSPGSGTPFDGGPGTGGGGGAGTGAGGPGTGGSNTGGNGNGGLPGSGGTFNPDGGAGANAADSGDDGSCGCRTRSRGTNSFAWIALAAAGLLFRRRASAIR